MTELPETDELVDAIYHFAADQMGNRVPHEQIQQSLIAKGLDHELAAAVIQNLLLAQSKVRKVQAKSNMVYGVMWCLGGIIVLSLRSGMANSGLVIFLIWAAIIFGAISFVRGALQAIG